MDAEHELWHERVTTDRIAIVKAIQVHLEGCDEHGKCEC